MVGGNMETYNCNDCSMEVKGLTCGKCESELVYAEIGDNSIGVSQCPRMWENKITHVLWNRYESIKLNFGIKA